MLDEMAAGPGVERYLELNLRFHSELYALAGRPRLVEMIETLRDASSAYLHIYATDDFPSDRLDTEHREILAACRARDSQRAAAAVRRHLSHTVEHVAAKLEADARGRSPGAATGARGALAELADELVEHDAELISADPLSWPGTTPSSPARATAPASRSPSSPARAASARRRRCSSRSTSRSWAGPWGRQAGRKIARAFRRAAGGRPARRVALHLGRLPDAGGNEGARADARIAAATHVLRDARLPHVAVLLGPTTGGAWASIAAGADVIVAVPEATAAFAGHRVRDGGAPASIEDSVRSGQVDLVVAREELPLTLATLLGLLAPADRDLPPADVPTALGESRLPGQGWEAVERARSPERSRAAAYLDAYFDVRIPLSGDRSGGCDSGDALWRRAPRRHADRVRRADGRRQHARGLPTAARVIRLADRLRLPVLTLIDTPGAANDEAAEAGAIGPAIADAFAAIAERASRSRAS